MGPMSMYWHQNDLQSLVLLRRFRNRRNKPKGVDQEAKESQLCPLFLCSAGHCWSSKRWRDMLTWTQQMFSPAVFGAWVCCFAFPKNPTFQAATLFERIHGPKIQLQVTCKGDHRVPLKVPVLGVSAWWSPLKSDGCTMEVTYVELCRYVTWKRVGTNQKIILRLLTGSPAKRWNVSDVSDVSDVSTNSCDFWLQTARSFGGQNLDSPGLRLAPCCRNHPGWWNQPEARPRQMKHMKPWSDARIISYKRILYVPQCVSRMQRACPMSTSPATIATIAAMQMGLRVRSWSRVKQKEPGPIGAWLYNMKWFKCVHWFEISSISWSPFTGELDLQHPKQPKQPQCHSHSHLSTTSSAPGPGTCPGAPSGSAGAQGCARWRRELFRPLDREMNGIGWPFINPSLRSLKHTLRWSRAAWRCYGMPSFGNKTW